MAWVILCMDNEALDPAALRREARALVEADPFFLAGIYQRIELHPFTPAAGQRIGGTLWDGTRGSD